MKADFKIAWATIIGLAVMSLIMFFTALSRGDEPVRPSALVTRIASLVPRYASKKDEPVDAVTFAEAVDTACKHERECVARLVAMAVLESGLSAAVSRSEFLPHQGDSFIDKDGVRQHRAWGTWELHRSSHNADVFGSDDLLVQAKAARSMQLGALAECRKFRGATPEVMMWRVLSGRGCMAVYSGEVAREALRLRIRSRL